MYNAGGYRKIKSLKKLVVLGFNTYEYLVENTVHGILGAIQKYNKVCTIRTDSKDVSWNYPFYIVKDEDKDYIDVAEYIIKEEFTAIISNGLRYDVNLRYNINTHIDSDGSFMCEWCAEKVPLRKMYNYKTNVVIGNIDEDIAYWCRIRIVEDNKIDLREIQEYIRNLYSKGLENVCVEASTYSVKLGYIDEYTVYHEIIEKK